MGSDGPPAPRARGRGVTSVSIGDVMSRLIAVTILVFLLSSPAWAYLDPGTGSMLVQGLVAALAVVSAAVAAFWTRIRQLFSGRKKPDREPPDAPRQ